MKGAHLWQLWPQILFDVRTGSGAPPRDAIHTRRMCKIILYPGNGIIFLEEGMHCLFGSLRNIPTCLLNVAVNFILRRYLCVLFTTGLSQEGAPRGKNQSPSDGRVNQLNSSSFNLGFTDSLKGWTAGRWGRAWVWLLQDCNKTLPFDPDMQNCATRTGWQIHARRGHDLSHQN